ncbi:MAG: hypothetical protein KGQ59_05745 [Bdellovibrionales bacterium]|nr:hypothetical protein [Bdellovibrionales bacterium]
MNHSNTSTPAMASIRQSAWIAMGVARWSAWMAGFFLVAALFTGLLISSLWFLVPKATAAEALVYSVYQGVDLGDPPGETPDPKAPRVSMKDYFINVGTAQGIRNGTVLEVSRKMPTYDLLGEKLYKEIVFPIGTVKVIHVEAGVAIARLEKLFASDKTPVSSPRAIMVGDLVRKAD